MKKNSKFDKRNVLLSSLLAISFIVFVLIVVRDKFCYGSTLDWESQHFAIPEYFRMLFYRTHDLLPDFAFNLGSGQNIYNFAYYGLLSPFILISYLLPFIGMIDYIQISSVVSVIASGILFYFWLRRNNDGKYLPSFLASNALIFATSLSFHSHRHVMFINYMPFMVMGLFGVDKKLRTGKGWLLSLSVFLMIMTSYYYSVGGIIFLVLYGIYRWIERTSKPNIKKFFVEGFKFLLPIIIGIVSSCIILLPTLHVILFSRGETFNTITIKDLLIPGLNIEYMLYNTYGVGLTSILVLAIINLLFKKRENLYLGIVLALLITFPFLNYLLNATMYIDAKSLIPVLPVAVYAIYVLIVDLLEGKVDLKRLYVVIALITLGILIKGGIGWFFLVDIILLSIGVLLFARFNKKVLLVVPILVIPVISSLSTSLNDELVSKKKSEKLQTEFKDVLSSITESDDGMYRISNAKTILRDVNNLYGNIDYYSSTLYSSTYNMDYNKFYYDVMNNPIQNRNRVITSPTTNVLFLMYSGNKYLVDNQANYFGYELYKEVDGDKIFKNDDVFPIAYARGNVMSKKDYESLSYPDRVLALMNGVISESEETNYQFTSPITEIDFDIESLSDLKNVTITKEGNNYRIEASNKAKATYVIPSEYRDKIMFIRFKMLDNAPCSQDDSYIMIDGAKNKLTCKSWKYHNQNFDFDYILSNKDRENYEFSFSEGSYRITDVEAYVLDYEDVSGISKTLDEFHFDKDRTKGDFIIGDIDVSENGYFVTSIPYDDGFEIHVDGEKIEHERINEGFLGFKISRGKHEVKIEYHSPWKKEATIISGFGILSFAIITFIERKKTTL